ncbi:diacylglycerol kinase family protein [Luteipulveratus sp. YIM 133132]|uniref:Diacylglycerol kinase family protein n=1 Tax=Luteipulveratus flavus TaxID=3031728 RepID=A0ABT6CDB8_9MICO|nr:MULTISPECIES: diacylglycerol kinase family protein [unclassified Luteipulveratus]MDE9365453.1 diacylglycerol kinase family protein [Luteipulveratus sp. YIM 133132]MDF8266019.1 diacylglycerol kinase family protein [Luteipulveratus sp. YIM 133296]
MKRGALIVNPTKTRDVDRLRHDLTAVFAAYGWAEPLWLETTVEDPGISQGHQALAEGADLVCPLGGDGTVRCVATALRGSGVPMGLLAGGTGNLLARNLGLPFRRYTDGLRVALSGRDFLIDVGTVRLDRDGSGEHVEDHCFLVMAGHGLDADMLGGTPEPLKTKIGWMAYVVAGAKHLRAQPVATEVYVDGHLSRSGPATTVMVGNCGQLTGGVRLMPQARVDDGLLNGVVLSAGRPSEWTRLVMHVLSTKMTDSMEVSHLIGQEFTVQAAEPRSVELDGDLLGETVGMTIGIDRRSLAIRVP